MRERGREKTEMDDGARHPSTTPLLRGSDFDGGALSLPFPSILLPYSRLTRSPGSEGFSGIVYIAQRARLIPTTEELRFSLRPQSIPSLPETLAGTATTATAKTKRKRKF